MPAPKGWAQYDALDATHIHVQPYLAASMVVLPSKSQQSSRHVRYFQLTANTTCSGFSGSQIRSVNRLIALVDDFPSIYSVEDRLLCLQAADHD
jgi:hypothetical protein